MSMFQELEEYLCCEEYIGKGAVAVRGKGNLEAFTECIEVVTRSCWEEVLTEEHGAQAQREFNVSPAEFLLCFEETPIEGGIVCNEGGIFCKCKEFREDSHDGRSIMQGVVGDVVDPLGVRWYGTFGVYQ